MSNKDNLDRKADQFYKALVRKAAVMAILAGFIVSTLGTASDAFAGTKEWDGFADGFDPYWTTNNNWKGIGGAGPNDDLIFADKVCNFITGCFRTLKNTTTTNDFPVNTSFDSLTLSGTRYRIRGNQIFLQNGLTFGKGQLGGAEPQPDSSFDPNIILGNTQTWDGKIGNLTLNGVVHLNGHVLTVTPLDLLVMNGPINMTGRIDKRDAGILTINGDADGTGRFQVFDGALDVNGSIGRVDLFDGTLQGTGFVGDIECGNTCVGTISPGSGGNTTAILRSVGEVEISTNARLAIDLNGPTAGTQYDQLRVTNGNVVIGGTDLELSLGFTPTVGQQFVIVSQVAAGTVTGQFDQGISIVKDNQLFSISYNQNSIVLTALGPAVP